MKMVGRVTLAQSDPRGSLFEGLAKGGLSGLLWVWDCDQNAATWPQFLEQARALEDRSRLRLSLKFTPTDIKRADWAFWHATGFTGYPQPENTYKADTYDRAGACDLCNNYSAGKRQVAPFRMRGEPALGRRSIMQMHWVNDAWFVTCDAYAEVFEPFGIGSRPAFTKGGRELASVRQLVIDEYVEVDEYRTEGQLCAECGSFRLHAGLDNYAPSPVQQPSGPLAYTATTYGSGGVNFHETLIRHDLREAIQEAGLRGTSFHPCGSAAQRRAFEVASRVPVDLLAPAPVYHLQRSARPIMPNVYAPSPASTTPSSPPRDALEADARVRSNRARKLLAQSSGLATTEALVAMGSDFYEAGALDEALTMFGRAAQDGDSFAMSMVARLLNDDVPDSAETWRQRASDSVDPFAP